MPPPPGEDSLYDAPTRIGSLLQPDIANMFAAIDGAAPERPHTVPPVSHMQPVRDRVDSQSGLRPAVVPSIARLYDESDPTSRRGQTVLLAPSVTLAAVAPAPPAPAPPQKRPIDVFDVIVAVSGAVVVLAAALVVYAYVAL